MTDDLDDLEYQAEIDADTQADKLAALARSPLSILGDTVSSRKMTKEEEDEREAALKDIALWEKPLPDYKEESRYWGNLGFRFTQGIDRATIKKMTLRDRISAARQCYDMRQLSLDRPTMNVSFSARKDMNEALPEIMKELKRRELERNTLDITPKEASDV